VYDPPMTFTILSGRLVDNTGCPPKSSTKGGHPTEYLQIKHHLVDLGIDERIILKGESWTHVTDNRFQW
jgi:hypothetical protein